MIGFEKGFWGEGRGLQGEVIFDLRSNISCEAV
jgi:hypothetical protein